MRLLLISTDFPPDVGGTQTYSFELSKRLTERFEKFAVVTPHIDGCEALDRTLPFSVHRVRTKADLFPIRARNIIGKLGKVEGFDTAFCVSWQSALACALAKRSGGPSRIFAAAHGRELLLNPFRRLPLLGRFYARIRTETAMRGVHRFYAVSRYTRDILVSKGVAASNVSVLNNGTDPFQFYPEDATKLRAALGLLEKKVILTISRLVGRKGIDTVIRAMPLVHKKVPDAVYVVAGEGPERERLEALIQSVGIDECVQFIGRIEYDDLRAYYNCCDVFVLPARESIPDVEGFGIVFLEAAACGKPVVGANTGGIPDAVLDGKTGLLVPPDDEKALADALTRILLDPDLATRLGKAGKDHVAEVANWDAIAVKLADSLKRY